MSVQGKVHWDSLPTEERMEIHRQIRYTAQLRLLEENSKAPDQRSSERKKRSSRENGSRNRP